MRLLAALPPTFKRDSAHQYGLTAGLAATEFLYMALLARDLGPRTFGILVIFLGAARICQGLTDLRAHELVIRYADIARGSGNAATLHAVLMRTLRVDLVSTLAGFLLALTIVAAAPHIVPGASEAQPLLAMAAISVAVTWVGRFWSIGVFRLFHRVDRQARIQLGGALAKLILTWTWFALFTARPEPTLLIAALSGGITAIVLLTAAWRIGQSEEHSLGSPTAPASDVWEGWRRYAGANYGIGLLEIAYRELDVQLIGWFTALEEVSVYKLAKTFAGLVLQAVDPVVLLLLPHFARHVREGRLKELRAFISHVASLLLAGGMTLGLASHFAVRWFLPLLGTAYAGSAGVFQIIVWCLVATTPFLWTHALSMALGRSHLYLFASAGGVAVLVGLSASLVPAFGASGAAWSYGGSQIAVALLSLLFLAGDRGTPAELRLRRAT